MTVNK